MGCFVLSIPIGYDEVRKVCRPRRRRRARLTVTWRKRCEVTIKETLEFDRDIRVHTPIPNTVPLVSSMHSLGNREKSDPACELNGSKYLPTSEGHMATRHGIAPSGLGFVLPAPVRCLSRDMERQCSLRRSNGLQQLLLRIRSLTMHGPIFT